MGRTHTHTHTHMITQYQTLKGFEKVKHHRVAKLAGKYGLPKKILRLALDMYRSAGRSKCGDALSTAAYTVTAVPDGCPIEMRAQCFAMVDALDDFMKPMSEGCGVIQVYVDDVKSLGFRPSLGAFEEARLLFGCELAISVQHASEGRWTNRTRRFRGGQWTA